MHALRNPEGPRPSTVEALMTALARQSVSIDETKDRDSSNGELSVIVQQFGRNGELSVIVQQFGRHCVAITDTYEGKVRIHFVTDCPRPRPAVEQIVGISVS